MSPSVDELRSVQRFRGDTGPIVVRNLAAVLVVSVAVHGALLAWLRTYTNARPVLPIEPERDMAIEIVPAAPALPPVADVAPVEVAFLDEATTQAVPALPTPSEPRSKPRERISTRGATATTEVPGASATEPTGPRNPYMDMRRPGTPRIQLPKLALPRLEWNPDMPPGPPPPPDVTTGQLDDSGGGTKRSDQGVFVARVDQDGNVKLKDAKNLNIRIALPTPKMLGRIIADWYLDPNKPVGTLPPDHIEKAPVIGGDALHDPGTGNEERRADHGGVATVPILSGGFDVTDAFMRRHGQDPYASKKLAFLDSTREERVQIGMKHRSEQLAMTSETVRKNLAMLWANVADPAARREALFEMWDESEETGSAELVAAGVQARKLVIAWITAKLPAGSPDAYTAAELAAFNARRTSKAAFAPY